METLWLVGMMGAGKSAVGRRVAARLGETFVDLDEQIAAGFGAGIPELFAAGGEEAFREAEAEAVEGVAGRRAVVAAGGGAVLRESSRTAMRAGGLVVWLDAVPRELGRRVGGGEGRPLLSGREPAEAVAELAAAREPAYRDAAHHRLDTTGRSVDEVAEEVIALWTRS